jgi:type IV secretion system protein VirB4
LFVARTAKSNPFRFVPHADENAAAHTLVWGPSGNGKSGFLNWLRCMCQQVPDLQDLGLDIKASSKTTTLCFNGRFDDLGRGDVQLQPYRNIDDPVERHWAHEWTLRWLKDLNVEIRPRQHEFVMGALDRLAAVEPSARTMTGLLHTMAAILRAVPRRGLDYDNQELHNIAHMMSEVMTALKPFQDSILDGAHDGLRLTRVHSFELETLLDFPQTAKPVLRLVDHRIDQALDGRPTILWYEEVQALLDLEESVDTLNYRIRRARDKNVMLVAITQNETDILLHRLGLVFMNNCPNKIFLANSAALSDDNVKMYTRLGLTYPQCQLLARAVPRAQWLYKSDLGTRLVEHRFDPLALAVCGRSGKAWHAQVDQVLAEVGPEAFPQAWLARQGVWSSAREVANAAD